MRGLAIAEEWPEMRILRTGLPVLEVEAQRSCLPAFDGVLCLQLGKNDDYRNFDTHYAIMWHLRLSRRLIRVLPC